MWPELLLHVTSRFNVPLSDAGQDMRGQWLSARPISTQMVRLNLWWTLYDALLKSCCHCLFVWLKARNFSTHTNFIQHKEVRSHEVQWDIITFYRILKIEKVCTCYMTKSICNGLQTPDWHTFKIVSVHLLLIKTLITPRETSHKSL